MRFAVALTVALALPFTAASAQTKRQPAKRPPARPPAAAKPITSPADATCPSVLGTGVGTKLVFCDVMTGRDPAAGIVIKIPPHRGTATLTFNLHNRHTYSEEQVRARRAFARYTASVVVVTPDGTILDRGLVQSEFRTARDLVDRIAAGAGAAGVKAIAPTGTQPIVVTLPEDVESVSIVGEKLTADRLDGTANYASPGRPIAIVSNLQVEYRPATPRRRR